VRPRVSNTSAALFLTARGARYRGDSLSAAFAHYRDLAGLSPDLTLHCLRHTFATKLHELGYELPYISHLLGHSSEAITVLYDHLDFDYLRRRVLLHNQQVTRICRN
jgi:site-specific recombinase XerD